MEFQFLEQYAGMRFQPVVPDLNLSPLSQSYRGYPRRHDGGYAWNE